MITKKGLQNLVSLARIDIKPSEEEKLLKDLSKILDHFEELKEVNTDNVEPMSGGTFSKNVFREDELTGGRLPSEAAVEQFPEKEKGFLKVPPVFE